MRWLIAFILIALVVWYFLPEPEPRPVEETFIGDQIEALNKAEQFEQEYLDAVRERQEKMEAELDKEDGG